MCGTPTLYNTSERCASTSWTYSMSSEQQFIYNTVEKYVAKVIDRSLVYSDHQ